MKRLTLKSHLLTNPKLLAVVLWVMYFCFAISAALIFQKLVLPLITSIHAPGSNFSNDSAYFDSVAWSMAQDIHQHGWASWKMFPTGAAAINVAILSALYALFGHDPTLAIPLNAAFHALGGVLLFMLAIELAPNKAVGVCAGVITATLFVVFPSALNWYGQIHKDGFAIAGALLLLLIWVKAIKHGPEINGSWWWLVVANVGGVVLVAAIRPYYLKILFIVILGALVLMLAMRMLSKQKNSWLFFLVVLVTLIPAEQFIVSAGASQAQLGEGYAEWKARDAHNYIAKDTPLPVLSKDWHWRPNALIPDFFENQIETVAKTRAGLIYFGKSVHANSLIDESELPQSVGDVVAYLPRAFQVALLAPFPSSWVHQLNLQRMVSIAEMSIMYICMIGLVFLWRLHRKPPALFAAYFASMFLIVYGVTTANVGTLYRVRYGFEFVIVLLGVVGWLSYLDQKGFLARWVARIKSLGDESDHDNKANAESTSVLDRQSVIGAGISVITLTFFGFFGFFIRDILMAHSFGLGASLDAFFMALMIPMFVVTVFCTSLGSAFVPYYTNLEERLALPELRPIISHLSAVILSVLFAACVLLYFVAPYLLSKLHLLGSTERLPYLVHLMGLALPILLFSGVVILGNAILNANQRFTLPSAGQLVVPLAAILALLLFGSRFGVLAVVIGMVVGQLLNLLIIQICLNKSGISLMPKFHANLTSVIMPLWKQYIPLLASAFFVSVSLPIDTMLAATLPEGNISAFNLGTKVVIFISGLLGAAISSVMLPYFSMLVEKRGLHKARKELSLFLLIATFVSIVASAVLYVLSEPIVRFLFATATFDANDVLAVSRVMQYVVIQIPFFVCNMLLLKYATATRHSVTITLTALAGLAVNIGVSLFLMPRMGASGIAFAASFSMLISSALLIVALVRFGHIQILDAMVILLNWMLFITLLVAEHFRSPSSIAIVITTYVILVAGYLNLMRENRELIA
jgi:murein biosynthesis integral membrane protein MurJ